MSFKAYFLLFVSLICLGLIGWVYYTIVSRKLAVAAIAVDKASVVASSSGFFSKLNAHLMHWKTIILAWIAVLAQAFSYISSETLQGWAQLPWSNVVDAKIANWITIGCALLIPITHASGLATAAKAVPTATPEEN